ncbi:lipid-A-disaccharide synthase N-terminal domain-containing protein [Leptotrichia trevisanii]|uniref:lipid-A-disaccharide synthase N-terminal domain-containing protein n=1 Tax=Leptotrichia trevisanii TaxID=109328 RepID=UPI0026EEDA64|nr:lipid-A-disaccharide synthase N-terminal domain-containing protein [Leptotrichia trevisanii]
MRITLNNFFIFLGLFGQLMFTGRFVVQWVISEKKKKSVVPFSFWILSILGSSFLLIYAIYRKDPVFSLGQSVGLFIYIRNLIIIKSNQKNERKKLK